MVSLVLLVIARTARIVCRLTHTHARTHVPARTCTHTHTHTHTHTQDNYSNPRCACALRVNNVYMILWGKAKKYVQNYRNACKLTQPTCTCTYILYIIDACTLHTYCTLHTCIFHGWSNCPPPCSQKSPADLLMLLVGSV